MLDSWFIRRGVSGDPPVNRGLSSAWMKAASMLLYTAALALPAYRTGHDGVFKAHHGIEALLTGFLGLAVGQIAWLGNVFLLLAWWLRPRAGVNPPFICAMVSIALALTFLGATSGATRGPDSPTYHAAAGYFFWLASMVAAAVAALVAAPRGADDTAAGLRAP